MAVAISRLADLLSTCVAVAFDVDTSRISDYCDTSSEPACDRLDLSRDLLAIGERQHGVGGRSITHEASGIGSRIALLVHRSRPPLTLGFILILGQPAQPLL